MDELYKEPDYQQAYKDWTKLRTPQATGQFLTTLKPVIQHGVANYGGGKNDPLVTGRARRITLNAVKSYDPRHGTRLTTHINNHLQGLRRVVRQQQQVLKTPDRVAMEQAALHASEMELEDRLGRNPSITELADHAGLSPAKITRIRRYVPGMPEGALEASGAEAAFTGLHSPQDRGRRLAQIIHPELDPRDQKIAEWTLGLFGGPQLDNRAIAAKLNVTPGYISQRKALIQQKIDHLSMGGL